VLALRRGGQVTYLWMISLLGLFLGVVIAGTLLLSYRNRGIIESRSLVREYGWFEDINRSVGESVLYGIRGGVFEAGRWYVLLKVRRRKGGDVEAIVRGELLERDRSLREWLEWYFSNVVRMGEDSGWSHLFRYRRVRGEKVLIEFLASYRRPESPRYGLRRMVALYRIYLGEPFKVKSGTAMVNLGDLFPYFSSTYALDPFNKLVYPEFGFQSVFSYSSTLSSSLSGASSYELVPFSAGADVYLVAANVPYGDSYLDLSGKRIRIYGKAMKLHDISLAVMSERYLGMVACGRKLCLPSDIGDGTESGEVFREMTGEELSDFLASPSGSSEEVQKKLVSGLGTESSILLEPYYHTKSAYDRLRDLGLSFSSSPISGTVKESNSVRKARPHLAAETACKSTPTESFRTVSFPGLW